MLLGRLMNKQVFTTFFVLMILSVSVSAGLFDWITGKTTVNATTSSVCKDSDGGSDYYVNGESFLYLDGVLQGSASEYCWDSLRLRENKCKSSIPRGTTDAGLAIDVFDYNCPNGCSDGACLKSAPVTENQATTQPTITGKPDFTISYLAVSNPNPKINEVIKVKFTVLNKGSPFYKSSTQFGGVDYTLTRSDSNLKGTMASGWINKDLLTNQEETLSFDAQILDKQTTFEVIVDSGEYIAETYETNNRMSLVVNAQTEQGLGCGDSDGGLNYLVKGTAQGYLDTVQGATYDCCTDSSTSGSACKDSGKYLNEAICSGTTPDSTYFQCQYGCKEGTCLTAPVATTNSISCTDSDGGKSYDAQGVTDIAPSSPGGEAKDYCDLTTGQLVEYYCTADGSNGGASSSFYICPNGCKDGICIGEAQQATKCTDSDGGRDYYVKGRTQVVGGLATEDDFCTGSVLTELYCVGNAMNPERVTCPSGCSNGACIQGTTRTQPIAIAQPTTTSEVPVKKCGVNSFSVNNICTDVSTGNVHFRNAYFQCYDGIESYQGDSTSCKPSELWKKYGQEFCEGHCNTNMQKATTVVPATQTTTQPVCPSAIEVNTQIQKCKDAGLGLQTQISADSETNCMKVSCEKTATQEPIKCNACLVDNACLPIGTRFNKQFCDVDNKMKGIKADLVECSNSFECTSNLCINDACVSGNVWNKIMAWFSKIF